MAKSTSHPSDLADKFMLRLPDGVREMLKLQADHNKRSMNAEIVARLLESLEPWKPGDEPVTYERQKTYHSATKYDIDELLTRLETITQAVSKAAGREKK